MKDYNNQYQLFIHYALIPTWKCNNLSQSYAAELRRQRKVCLCHTHTTLHNCSLPSPTIFPLGPIQIWRNKNYTYSVCAMNEKNFLFAIVLDWAKARVLVILKTKYTSSSIVDFPKTGQWLKRRKRIYKTTLGRLTCGAGNHGLI